MSFLTCFCDFPQKEHFSRSPPSPMRATYASSPSCPPTASPPPGRLGRRYPVPRPLHLVCRLVVVSASLQSTQFAGGQHFVHETVLLRLLRCQDLVPFDVGADPLHRLPGVPGEDLLLQDPHPLDLVGGDLQVGDLHGPL